jgi:cobalt-zinc-cadmium efflux system membrane fusion protein
MLKRWFFALVAALPPLLVVVLLAAVAYWGHANEWKAPKFDDVYDTVRATLFGGDDEAAKDKGKDKEKDEAKAADASSKDKKDPGPPDWCVKHSVPDSLCPVCHPELVVSKYLGKYPPLPMIAGPAIAASHKAEECHTHLDPIKFKSPEAFKNSGVQVEAVREQTITETVTAHSEIDYDPDETFKLSARTNGTVWRVTKHLGDRVKAGELVALIDSSEVGKAKSEYLQAVVQRDTRTKAYEMLKSGSGTVRAVQEAESAVREARARLFTAEQALLNFGLPLRGDEASLPDDQLIKHLQFLGIPADIVATFQTNTATANLLPLIAPRSGTVIDRKAEAGETVAALHPLFVVSDVEHVHAHLDIRPEDVARVLPDARVEFKPDSDTRTYAGHLHTISTALDEKTRLVHAHAHMHNVDGRLRAHLYGTATITVAAHEKAVVVPADALQWEGCSHVVFVRDPQDELTFHARKVVLGLRQNGVVEILVGLRPGETIATTGSHVLKSYLFRDRLGSAEG